MKEKKNVQKSIRMTEQTADYVDSFPGNGFNEKFENLVYFCMANEKSIQQKITAAENRLGILNKEISTKRQLVTKLQSLEIHIDSIIQKAEL